MISHQLSVKTVTGNAVNDYRSPITGYRLPIEVGGAFNINKSKNISSFDVVRKIRAILGEKRVGHCGTLDPMATGVLPIVYGKATSASERLMSGEKVYLAEMTLGIQTDTGDVTGNIIHKTDQLPALDEEKIKKSLEKFVGELIQTTPRYSAAKFRGRKLYEYARRGETVVQPKRMVTVHAIELISVLFPKIIFRTVCSKGTYIRSLVEDIGQDLNCPAVLSGLVREKAGPFSIDESLNFESVLQMTRSELLSKAIGVRVRH